ncbi:MAG: NTP transferase domain-containing protein [Woeseia sp.]|nr:NTP transferase domain-containing protein [Woeseia sp.]
MVNEAPPLFGLVLAGGESRRMGVDKALLRHGDESQLDYAVRMVSTVVAETWVSARKSQGGAERAQYPLILDRYENLGPAAGILSAMDHDPRVAWLVLACDLPNVTASTLRALVAGRAENQPFTAFRSSHNDLPEPLCAIYEPGARQLLDGFIGEGINCPRKVMIRSNTRLLSQPDPASLDNINTPQDLARSPLQQTAQ